MTSATADGANLDEVTWHDPKRYAWLLGLVVPAIPFIVFGVAIALRGTSLEWLNHGVWWLAFIVVFAVIPLLDFLIGNDAENPPEDLIEWLENDKYYQWILYLYMPIQYAGFILACWVFVTWDLNIIDRIGLAVTVGVVSGIGINTAHELGHKKVNHERWLSKVVLAQSFYGHFFIEHNRGHHVRVATPEDPASSRFGESFWAFAPRSVWGSLKSAWAIESKRFERLGKSKWSIKNDVLNAWLMSIVLFGGVMVGFSFVPGANVWTDLLPYLVIQAVFGFMLLEVVNYLEHYGLLRQRTGKNGRYERPAARHSWNSNNVVTNVFLYHLQRHSDHHANPTRRYQALRDFDEAPQLPNGYAGMIVFAWLTPLWYKIMNPRVLEHYDGDITKANINPRKREKILARYGAKAAA